MQCAFLIFARADFSRGNSLLFVCSVAAAYRQTRTPFHEVNVHLPWLYDEFGMLVQTFQDIHSLLRMRYMHQDKAFV